jgi:hypothetical protein
MNGDAPPSHANADPNQTGAGEPTPELAAPAGLAIARTDAAEPNQPIFYIPSLEDGPLRQTEILSGVHQHNITIESLNNPDGVEVAPINHELAIIVSQDCDLEQDFNRREELRIDGATADRFDTKLLPTVLLCEVSAETQIRVTVRGQGDSNQQFRHNKIERYQFLRAVGANEDALGDGLGAMGIDFKRYFAIPTAELYAQLDGQCQRRCRLGPQYLEHFCARFSNFLSRIGLPKNHHE